MPAPPAPPAAEDFSVSPKSIQDSFRVWLQGVAGGGRGQSRALTPGEVTAVSLATVRESCKHRHWPREVVERFLATEVITRPLASHRAAGEPNKAARRFNFLRMPEEGYSAIAHMLRR